jgi:hypothetical protein
LFQIATTGRLAAEFFNMKSLLMYIILGAPGLHLPFSYKFGEAEL